MFELITKTQISRHFIYISIISSLFVTPVFAISLELATPSSSLSPDQEFTLNYFFSCHSCKQSYLRAVIYKEGTTNYFGYTRNQLGQFVNSTSDKSIYFSLSPEQLTDGSISGTLVFKIDPESKFYSGGGDYQIKIGRYTGSDSSALWSNSFPIRVEAPVITSTPSPASSPTTIVTPSPTVTPISAISATPNPTQKPTPTITTTPTPTLRSPASRDVDPSVLSNAASAKLEALTKEGAPTLVITGEVLSDSTSSTPAGEPVSTPSSPSPIPAYLLGIAGLSYLLRRQYLHYHH